MIVVRVQRGGVGNRPIVLGVFLERAERPGEWAAHPSAKLGTHAHGPQGRRQEAREFELDGFVQRNTEHVIQRFERSEERRVGKECRSRRWPYQYKNKNK